MTPPELGDIPVRPLTWPTCMIANIHTITNQRALHIKVKNSEEYDDYSVLLEILRRYNQSSRVRLADLFKSMHLGRYTWMTPTGYVASFIDKVHCALSECPWAIFEILRCHSLCDGDLTNIKGEKQ
jgi:hypothetical protein